MFALALRPAPRVLDMGMGHDYNRPLLFETFLGSSMAERAAVNR